VTTAFKKAASRSRPEHPLWMIIPI
jgi:hypothetical protein